jgi:aarF domain-containing kinase
MAFSMPTRMLVCKLNLICEESFAMNLFLISLLTNFAGNLLACPDGRLCYLDFGMMSYAAQHQRNGFLLAVVHIVNRDWHELAKVYVRLGFIPEGTDLRPIELALENTLPDILSADVSELNFKNVINSLGDIM